MADTLPASVVEDILDAIAREHDACLRRQCQAADRLAEADRRGDRAAAVLATTDLGQHVAAATAVLGALRVGESIRSIALREQEHQLVIIREQERQHAAA